MSALIAEIGTTLNAVAQRVGPAVVGLGRGWGRGSGIVVAPNRVVVTAHSLRGDEAGVVFSDGRRAVARVAGVDPDADLAVLEVDTGDTDPVEWDPSTTDADLGTPVIALANPGGRGLRATLGFVSTAERSFRGGRGRRLAGIEHTAPLPRGSAGGPLVTLDGRLLGVNALRLDGGLILAITGDTAMQERVERLARGEISPRRHLGIAVAPPPAARRMRRAVGLPDRPGVLVRAVEDESPASRAGIARGDLVVSANGRAIESLDDLYSVLDAPEVTAIQFTIVRGLDERAVEVSLDPGPKA
jgi:S1-C subfamily serine protease